MHSEIIYIVLKAFVICKLIYYVFIAHNDLSLSLSHAHNLSFCAYVSSSILFSHTFCSKQIPRYYFKIKSNKCAENCFCKACKCESLYRKEAHKRDHRTLLMDVNKPRAIHLFRLIVEFFLQEILKTNTHCVVDTKEDRQKE